MSNSKKSKKQKQNQKGEQMVRSTKLPEGMVAAVTASATFGDQATPVSFEITFRKAAGGTEKLYLTRSDVDNRGTLRKALLDADAALPPRRDDQAIIDEIQTANPAQRIRFTLRPGWHGKSFVLPDETISGEGDEDGSDRKLWTPPDLDVSHLLPKGSLKRWIRLVATPCQSSPTIMFAIGVALSAPLYRQFADMPRFIHFSGGSGFGKSLTLKIAHSVSGWPPNGKLPTWATTKTALQESVTMRSDACAFLDELAAIAGDRAKFIEESAFRVSGGIERTVSRTWKSGHSPMASDWNGPLISAGEEAPADLFRAARKKRLPGEERRFINVPVVAEGREHVFDELPENCETLDEAYVQIIDGARANHGVALRAFVRKLIVADDAEALVRTLIDDFYVTNDISSDGWNRSYAQPFALTYAAILLAIDWHILPWDKDEASAAAGEAYRRSRGTVRDTKTIEREAVEALLCVLKGDDVIDLRKGAEADQDEVRDVKSVFRISVQDNPKASIFALRRERLAEIAGDAGGFPLLVGALRAEGLLVQEPGRPGVLTRQVQVPGTKKKPRLVCIKAASLKKLVKRVGQSTD